VQRRPDAGITGLSPTIICSHGSDGTTESVKRGPTKKNAVINYCVILSYYTIDDCCSVIRGPMYLKYCYKKTFTVYCKRRRAIFAHYFIPSASERISRKIRANFAMRTERVVLLTIDTDLGRIAARCLAMLGEELRGA
jgi:hypothetical protein